jgi:hypothetical protein
MTSLRKCLKSNLAFTGSQKGAAGPSCVRHLGCEDKQRVLKKTRRLRCIDRSCFALVLLTWLMFKGFLTSAPVQRSSLAEHAVITLIGLVVFAHEVTVPIASPHVVPSTVHVGLHVSSSWHNGGTQSRTAEAAGAAVDRRSRDQGAL